MIKYSSKHCNTPIIYVNQVGGNDDLIFDGNSFAVNKKGEIVLRSKSFEETIDFINLKVKNNDPIKICFNLTSLSFCWKDYW